MEAQEPVEPETQSNINKLESRVAELEEKKKDIWDVVSVIGGLLIPVTIAVVGWEYSQQIKEAEIQSNARQQAIQSELARDRQQAEQSQRAVEAKLKQAQLIDTFFEELIDAGNEKKRELALAAIVHALPSSEAQDLLATLRDIVTDPVVRESAGEAEQTMQANKVANLEKFASNDAATRKAAFEYLIANHRSNPSIVPWLLASVGQNDDNVDVANNALLFFAQMDAGAVSEFTTEVLDYAESKRSVGPNTRRKIRTLVDGLQCTGPTTQLLDHQIAERGRFIPVAGALTVWPISLNSTAATVEVKAGEKTLIDQFNMAPGETTAFPYQGSVYRLTLNWIDAQRFTRDLRINVNMTVTPCA